MASGNTDGGLHAGRVFRNQVFIPGIFRKSEAGLGRSTPPGINKIPQTESTPGGVFPTLVTPGKWEVERGTSPRLGIPPPPFAVAVALALTQGE